MKGVDTAIPLRIIGRAICLMVESELTMEKDDIIAQIYIMSLKVTNAEELIYYRLAMQLLARKS